MQQIKKSQYRLRVYQLSDLSIQLVFGEDPAPSDAKLLSDHDVSEVSTITNHVEAPSA